MIGHAHLEPWTAPWLGSTSVANALMAPEWLGCNDVHHVRAAGCLWGAV